MEIKPVKTRRITEGQDLSQLLGILSDKLKEKDILVVSSKIVSYAEGRLTVESEFEELVKSEAEEIYEGEIVHLTKKCGLWVANSGIDRSNAPDGQIVLWPVDPQKSVDDLYEQISSRIRIKDFGVMMIDSVCHAGRRGTSGACIAYRGFVGVSDERGRKDLFGNELMITQVAKADAIADAANLIMGEADECTPMCIVSNAPVEFTSEEVDSIKEQSISTEEDIFNPLIK
jgi:coenzyme F420-0:L-glutamate ligase